MWHNSTVQYIPELCQIQLYYIIWLDNNFDYNNRCKYNIDKPCWMMSIEH